MAWGEGIYWQVFKLHRLVKIGLIKPKGFKFRVPQPRNGLLRRLGVICLAFLGMGTAVSEAQMLCVGKGSTLPVSYGGKRIVPPEFPSGIVPRPGADKYVGDKLITPHHPVPPPNLGSLNNLSTIPGSLPCQRKKCMFCPSAVLTHT